MTEQLQGGWAAPRRVGQSKAGGPPQGGWANPRRVGPVTQHHSHALQCGVLLGWVWIFFCLY